MKVTQDKQSFSPIHITVESKEEQELLSNILDFYLRNSALSNNGASRDLAAGVWQNLRNMK